MNALSKRVELIGKESYSLAMANKVRETADIVYSTFRKLKAKEREEVIERLLQDEQFLEDLVDIVTIKQRRNEPGRPLREYLASRKSK